MRTSRLSRLSETALRAQQDEISAYLRIYEGDDTELPADSRHLKSEDSDTSSQITTSFNEHIDAIAEKLVRAQRG